VFHTPFLSVGAQARAGVEFPSTGVSGKSGFRRNIIIFGLCSCCHRLCYAQHASHGGYAVNSSSSSSREGREPYATESTPFRLRVRGRASVVNRQRHADQIAAPAANKRPRLRCEGLLRQFLSGMTRSTRPTTSDVAFPFRCTIRLPPKSSREASPFKTSRLSRGDICCRIAFDLNIQHHNIAASTSHPRTTRIWSSPADAPVPPSRTNF